MALPGVQMMNRGDRALLTLSWLLIALALLLVAASIAAFASGK